MPQDIFSETLPLKEAKMNNNGNLAADTLKEQIIGGELVIKIHKGIYSNTTLEK
jgi:hypothetical protein